MPESRAAYHREYWKTPKATPKDVIKSIEVKFMAKNNNTGTNNTGSYNTGHRNSGDENSGDRNSGSYNSGDFNSGNWNSGNRNSGRYNSGSYNTGHRNSGHRNSGSYNSGRYNSGDYNTGHRNSGSWNSGDWNSGSWNSGDWNSGDGNSGSWNSGNRNSGDFNSGNWNSGAFNRDEPKMRLFEKELDMTVSEFYSKYNIRMDLPLNRWVDESEMTAEEKKTVKGWETMGGYLKTLSFKEACRQWWAENPDEHERFLTLPGFDAEIFKDITGIDVEATPETIEIGGRRYEVTDELKAALKKLKEV